MGYTKLFSSIVASTIWREDHTTRLVWITMLAMKDERHVVEASVPGLADLARVTLKECEAALGKLMAADKWSRNQEYKGRRIEKCPGGWTILNGEYYRQKMSLEDRREYQRKWQAANRKALKTSEAFNVVASSEYARRRKPGIREAKSEGKMAGAQAAIADGLEEASRDQASTETKI